MDELERIARDDFGLDVIRRVPVTESLLIEGLDGASWEHVHLASPTLLRSLGRSIALMHRTPADSFDGLSSWHELLMANADRYIAMVATGNGGATGDLDLAQRGRSLLDNRVGEIPDSERPCLVHFDLRPGNVLVRDDRLVALIDFEACRGGHPSMDFFKLWQQVAPLVPGGLAEILDGYREVAGVAATWAEPAALDRLMTIYSAYHGTAGLAWCHSRGDFSGDFPAVNRRLIESAVAALD
jgi:aminoglycoside phosphotransferase (APT) family kinase protein